MTDDQTLTDQAVSEEVDERPAPGIDGQAAWPWIKDVGLLLFVVFFGFSYFVIRSVGLDDDMARTLSRLETSLRLVCLLR